MPALASDEGAPVRLGEAGLCLPSPGHESAQLLGHAIREASLRGVTEVVPAASSVGIVFDPVSVSGGDLLQELLELQRRLRGAPGSLEARTVEVEVCFDGQDAAAAAVAAGWSLAELVRSCESSDLSVGWLGFMPGFPYLVGLPDRLAAVERLHRPRARVPAGAVALAGGFAGIYPRATPGGWSVIGRTSIRLFDPDEPPYATLRPGDTVRFRAVTSLEQPHEGAREPLRSRTRRGFTVLDPGFLTMVEDAGRPGFAHLGVPRGGPADGSLHGIANLAVGNAAAAAALEITFSGPVLRFECDTAVALAGDCDLVVGGRSMPPGAVETVSAGETVSVGRVGQVAGGARAYLAVAGGVSSPVVLGSRSGDAISGIGPGPLAAGDAIDIGEAGRPRGRFVLPKREGRPRLRMLPGPEALGDDALANLLAAEWEVSPDSDRTGTRLVPAGGDEPPAGFTAVEGGRLASRMSVRGAIQLPPDGHPVVLGPDHGTVGGYRVIGVLCLDDIPLTGQLRPGETVRLEMADSPPSEAERPSLARYVSGWLATEPGALG